MQTHVCLPTKWRVAMDELEFIAVYQDAHAAVQKITDPELKDICMHILELVSSLNDRVLEMQTDEEELDE